MAKYKVGDIVINHKDGKILQVCEGNCCKYCCYNKVQPCLGGVPCYFLIDTNTHFKELPSLPPGTKVKVEEDLKVGTKYDYTYVVEMEKYKEVTIKDYVALCRCYKVYENDYNYSIKMFDQVINEPKNKQYGNKRN